MLKNWKEKEWRRLLDRGMTTKRRKRKMKRRKGSEMKLPRGRKRRTKRRKGREKRRERERYEEEKVARKEREARERQALADERERWRLEDMARWDREYGMKEQEIANAALEEATELKRDAALIGTTKRYGGTLKYMLPRMPSESAKLPALFRYGRKRVCHVRGPKQRQTQVDIAAVVIQGEVRDLSSDCRADERL